MTKLQMLKLNGALGAIQKLRYVFLVAFKPPTHLWLCFCNDFTKYLLNKICNGYILLTTHPPQWHNVICERPLIQVMLCQNDIIYVGLMY